MRRLAPALLLLAILTPSGRAQPPAAEGEKKYEEFDKVVKGAKELDGLFKLHHKDERLYAEIRPDQFDRPFLCPIAIAKGLGMGGYTLNFDEQWVLLFRKVGDKVHLVRRNVRFQAKKSAAVARAVETTYTDSILLALRIHSVHPVRQSVLINFNDIFLSDFAGLKVGAFDPNRSGWHRVKAFSRNVELEVQATFSGHSGDDSVIDDRGITVVVHYGLTQLPDDGSYQPRVADDRVGHFITVVKDFSTDGRDSAFVRYVNRWRLERADNDPKNKDKPSAPKKKIVFWIEKSVPEEYRAAVREGILEWNKAFLAVGFRDAIEVRQQESEDFDPEDVNYNTFRWITTGRGFAMGPSRANPLTGEILDADIIFDADMVRWWKQEYQIFHNGALHEPASLIQSMRHGTGLLDARLPGSAGWNTRPGTEAEYLAQARAARRGLCQCCLHKRFELGLAALAADARGLLRPGEKVPEDLVQQAIKETVMHEVGHTLGLRHNFKASTMLPADKLHDTSVTRLKGISGSVMDYNPVNLAPKGVKQGDFFNTTLGPYDYWVIRYAYKPLGNSTDGDLEELQKIAAECSQPDLTYGTDEDMMAAPDPLVNVWDLGSDTMKFAQDRVRLAEELMKDLAERSVDKGEGYQRTRLAFGMLLRQFGDGAYLVANHVGGEYMHRDHRGDPNARDPFVPVKAAKQREALRFLREHILTDRPFQFSPQLLRRLAADRWWHWGNETAPLNEVDYRLYDRILGIQRVALSELLDPGTLTRVQQCALKCEKEENALSLAELFRELTDAVWAEPAKTDKTGPTSVIRRNLQREHLRNLGGLVLAGRAAGNVRLFGGGRATPADARSLARFHLREVAKRIDATMTNSKENDDTTRAHLEECKERIAKVLNASLQTSEP